MFTGCIVSLLLALGLYSFALRMGLPGASRSAFPKFVSILCGVLGTLLAIAGMVLAFLSVYL